MDESGDRTEQGGTVQPTKAFLRPLFDKRATSKDLGKIVGGYLLFGVLWVCLSNWLLATWSASLSDAAVLNSGVYVLVTAGMLYWLLQRIGSDASGDPSKAAALSNPSTFSSCEANPTADFQPTAPQTFCQGGQWVRSFIENSPASAWVTDQLGQVLYVNPTYLETFDLSTQDVVGRSLGDLYPAEIATEFLNTIQIVTDTGQMVEVIGVAPRSDGTMGEFLVYKFPVQNNSGQRAIGNIAIDVTRYRQMETALRESEEKFRSIFGLVTIGIAQVDPTGRFLLVNQQLVDILQYSAEELYQKTFQEITHPDELETNMNYFRQLLAGEIQTFSMEKRYIRKDGSTVWIHLSSSLMREMADQPAYVIGVIEDITEQKANEVQQRQVEEDLKASNQRYLSLAKASPVGIFRTDTSGNCLYVNDRWCQIAGLTFDEALGTGWYRGLHPEDRGYISTEWDRSIQANRPFLLEYRFQRPDQSVTWVFGQAVAERNADGQITGYVGTITDISDRKAAEAALVESEMKFRRLVENANDMIFAVANDATFSYLSPKFTEMWGYDMSDFLYQPFTPLVHPEDLPKVLATSQRLLAGEQQYGVEFRTRRQDGSWFWITTNSTPIRDSSGVVTGFQGIARDMSERVQLEADRARAEEAIRQLNANLEQLVAQRTAELEATNRELESFSYSVSHDLRAPLRHINGFVTALAGQLEQSGASANPKVAHYLKVIQDSSHKMGLLIDGLLTLSRVGRRQMADIPVNLNRLAEAALAQIPEVSGSPDSGNTTQPAVELVMGDLPVVKGDPTLLQQVFANLLSNAVKFSRNQCPAQIEIGSLPDGTVFVRDNGVGFQMEYADQLFGAFQRLHPQAEFEGTGIGLAIVGRIIQRHKGTIWAESQPNQGATFFFKLVIFPEE